MLRFHSFIPSSPHPPLIPEATNTEADLLKVGVFAAHTGTVVGQPAGPSEARNALCTTPPEAAVANGVVWPIDVAETAWESGETDAVGSASIGRKPIGGGFHGSAFVCTSPSRCLLIRY